MSTATPTLTLLDALRARQMIAMRDGRLDEASKLAEQVARRSPSTQAWFDAGTVQASAAQCADAIKAFERALALDSAHTPSRLGIADCAAAQGNTALALKQVEIARRIDSASVSPAEVAMHRGRAFVRAGRFGDGRGHRLVEVDVLAGVEGLTPLLVVQADGRGDRDGVDLATIQQLRVVGVGMRNPEASGGGLGPARHRIANGLQTDPILDVLLTQMGQDSAQGDDARADDSQANDLWHRWYTFPLGFAPDLVVT